MKVFVLGHNGMLVHMVVKFLQSNNINVITTDDRWPIIKKHIWEFDGDYIINCIGSIPQKTKIFSINYEIPIFLDLHSPCKVIHPGTDSKKEDKYGISKKIAANYIYNLGKQTKVIKTSIIGPELRYKVNLLEWFLNQEGKVIGYTKSMWNGNTTLEWAKQCLFLMENWENQDIFSILENESISKYDLLNIIKEVFNKKIEIIPKEIGENRCLVGNIKTNNKKTQLLELKNFYYDN